MMFKKILGPIPPPSPRTLPVIVVSGLPRSGTSMMMKMLAEGGLEAVTDSLREADEDNPNGYFEFEPVKKLSEGDVHWLADAGGKIVKVVSALLEHLPPERRYKVLFMERDIAEVLASQQKMLRRRNEENRAGDAEMEAQFRAHLTATKFWLARQANIDVLYVEYGKMVSSPDESCQAIVDFLGVPLDISRMRAVPSQRLYRNRAAAGRGG